MRRSDARASSGGGKWSRHTAIPSGQSSSRPIPRRDERTRRPTRPSTSPVLDASVDRSLQCQRVTMTSPARIAARHLPSIVPWFLLLATACSPAAVLDEGDGTDLGLVDGKADAYVREVSLELAPGAVRRFRVRAVRFVASLQQQGAVPVRLSAKHYENEFDSGISEAPSLAADAEPEQLRYWTLRVHNEGDETLRALLRVEAVDDVPRTPTGILREVRISNLAPGARRWFRVRGADLHAELTLEAGGPARLSAQHYEVRHEGESSERPTLRIQSPGGTQRNWTLRVHNEGAEPLSGTLLVTALTEPSEPEPPPAPEGIPSLADPVRYENTWCTYGDSPPYVRAVRWEHPEVQAAMAAMAHGYRSIFSYVEWRIPYGLENERTGTPEEIRAKKARNFIRVLCGEHRDFPALIGAKLRHIAATTVVAGPEELQEPDLSDNLFAQLTYPAYVKLVRVMRRIYDARKRTGARDGYHYGYGAYAGTSRRVDHSVPPWTHCEMKFIFANYLTADAPSWIDPSAYESNYAAFRQSTCSEDDLAWMYNFRGHVNFQPLWLESNGFVHNSRRARGMERSRGDRSYYLRPFATRHLMARKAWATYLLYPEADHAAMIQASERGGGPILYIEDRDEDGDGLLDYRLFSEEPGCGDQGVGLPIPSRNCNMVSWEQAWYTQPTREHLSSWDPQSWIQPDLGFLAAVTTFEERMARFNQALDRHTNWGPTGYYMIAASDEGDRSPRFLGAYSPIVAASYEVSKSDFFVRRDYPSTDEFEQGRAKWLFVMRFRAEDYYDEEDLRTGRPMNFERHYFNETSLSNDYYDEHALDHWGWIPPTDWYAQVYLTYGDRGETPPPAVTVPPPPVE